MLDKLIEHFVAGQEAVPDLDLHEAVDPGKVLLHFSEAENGRCQASCTVDAQGEVLGIDIDYQDRSKQLTLNKPANAGQSSTAAVRAAASAGRARQRQVQMALHRESLKQRGFTDEELNKIGKKFGGDQALKTIDDNWKKLTEERGLSKDDIVNIASKAGAKATLEAVVSEPWQGRLPARTRHARLLV